MPRKEVGERSFNWELSTRDEVLFPKLSKKHDKMSRLIKKHYDSIDYIYEKVAKILDEHGIAISFRLPYRAFAEELYKKANTYSSKALELEIEAIAYKYYLYGLDYKIMKEIAKVMGLEVFKRPISKLLTGGLG